MTDRTELKQAITECIEGASAEGELSASEFERLQGLIEAIEAQAPYAAAERPDLIAGNWQTAFASFGAKHSAGKARAHASNLAIQSFNHLPSAPINVTDIRQEIDPPSGAYSNVILFEAGASGTEGLLIIHGAYKIDEDQPQRFHVAFDRAELRPAGSASLETLRQALELPEEAVTDTRFQPPKLWSDITYVDETMRINKGNFGGIYVMERCEHPMVAVG
jgi:hypothetical protein